MTQPAAASGAPARRAALTPAATALTAAGSLVAGFAVAAGTGVRPLGGLVLVVAAALCVRAWGRLAGGGTAGALLVGYAAAFALAHPLARVVGAWPAVLSVAAAVGAASYAATRGGRRVV